MQNSSFSNTKKVQSIFEQIIDLPEGERIALAESLCKGDAELYEQVKLLLDNEPRDSQVMDHLYGNVAESIRNEGFDLLGQKLGGYRLVGKLGRGGMADVYLAERVDGVYESKVAVKVIKSGDLQNTLTERFYQERKILANLKHPNIAQILDGGSTDSGLPYFVMEYVEGERVDEYCENHNLSVRERLEIYKKICSAVAFAHRNLIVHRDLKPANILVDRFGEPKLLDFGIAKIVDQDKERRQEAETLLAMTPHYASPEQLRGEILTTASDVYSLGVILYELLTGIRPTQISLPIYEVQSRTSEYNILPPSKAVLKGAGLRLHARDETPADQNKRLSKKLVGDLDTIVLKLLREEPERRYESVRALAEDIERHLGDVPITARKDSVLYQMDRFMRRHSSMVVVVTFALLVLFGSVGYQQWQVTMERDIALQERNKFKHTQDFLIGLFNISSPGEARGNEVTAREILDRGVKNIKLELEEQPEAKSEMLLTMGRVYKSLGLYEVAEELLQQSLDLRLDMSESSAELADSHFQLASLYLITARYSEGSEAVKRALDIYANIYGRESLKAADCYLLIGNTHFYSAKYGIAIEYYLKALSLYLRYEDENAAVVYKNLGNVSLSTAEFDSAIEYYRSSLTLSHRLYGEFHPEIANTYNNLALVYSDLGKSDLAISNFDKALEIYKKTVGEDHPQVAAIYSNFGMVYGTNGQYQLAAEYFKKAIEVDVRSMSESHPRLAKSYSNLGYTYSLMGDFESAIGLYEKSLNIELEALGSNHPSIGETYNNLGIAYTGLDENEKAESYFILATSITSAALGEKHPDVAEIYHSLGELYIKSANYADAEEYFNKAYQIRLATLGEEHADTVSSAEALDRLDN